MPGALGDEPPSVAAALDRFGTFFAGQRNRQGLLARRMLHLNSNEDSKLTATLIGELLAELRADGSLNGAFLPTAWRLIELMELGVKPAAAAASRRWLIDRQDLAGRFGEGCTPTRHADGACEHFIDGFLAAAGPAERLAPLTLPSGRMIRSDSAARFAASCLALRALVQGGHGEGGRHLASLRAIALRPLPNNHYPIDLVVVLLSSLAHLDPSAEEEIGKLLKLVLERQRADGSWPGTDLFLVLEALLALDVPSAREAVARAIPFLLRLQRPDGTFGAQARAERAWIGLRAVMAMA